MMECVALSTDTITVDYPIGEVFDFLADGTSNSLWRPQSASVIFAAGPPDRAVWAQTVRRADGRLVKADYRVTWYDRPGRLELSVVNGPVRPTTLFVLKSLGAAATRVTCSVDLKPRWWPFAFTRLGAKDARVESANILNLANALASRPGAGATTAGS
jgi:hypothetical protein